MATILLLQTSGASGSSIAMILQVVLIVGIFYFLLIRPQRQQAKQHREMVAALKRGDRVATLGGLVGEIVALNDDVVTLKTGEARVVVERNKVARRMNEGPATAEK
ncbi:MAG TPA: preprotein translocase subunit YajC [Longimicrobiaceae bacterium]|nr:preprotein translocase subunit YajC [Longimicrobiaceae bacterium]